MAHPKLVTAYAQYDFAVDGGATSTITLANSAEIPNNAIIVGCYTHVKTACATASGTATIIIKAGGVALSPAVNHTDNEFDTANQVSNVMTLNNSNLGAKATSDLGVQFTIADNALNAGVVDVYVQYYQSY
jgi:hypothetical protein